MAYWLFKSEPKTWSWQMQKQHRTTHWDGVRNYQAQSYMKSMKDGDLGFFYHSNQQKAIVGIVKVIKEFYPDHTDKTKRFGMVDVEYVQDVSSPVTLAQIKEDGRFTDFPLVKQSRLSVMPVEPDFWSYLLTMGEVEIK